MSWESPAAGDLGHCRWQQWWAETEIDPSESAAVWGSAGTPAIVWHS